MPVERYRSAEEMNAAPIRVVPGNAFERFVRHCARYRRLFPRQYPRGVFRFRSLEEAQAARDRIDTAPAAPPRG
jgi:hypothetical protein